MTKPVIPVDVPQDQDIVGEGAERIRETRQAIYDLLPINPDDLDWESTENSWPAGSLTGGVDPAVDNENPPTSDGFQDRAFLIGDKVLHWDYNIPDGHNAITPGPIDASDVTINVPDGSTWTIVGEEDIGVQYLRDLADVEAGASVTDQDALLWHNDDQMWKPGPAPKGPPGPPGPGFNFEGTVPTKEDIPGWPDSYVGKVGDVYVTEDDDHIWAWSGDEWYDVGPMGQKGKGWTGGSYNSANGITTFTSDDGLGFSTTDIRGGKGEKGDKGDKGDEGTAATVNVGSTSTGNAGTNALVTNSGSTSAAVFNFTVPKGDKGDPGDPATGVQLTNTAPWVHAQFNQLFIPQKSGSGVTSRLTWDPEMYPVVSLSMSSEPMYMTAPFPPTTDGTFIAITWVASRAGQVWTLDQSKFGDDVVAPENNGKDVTRIFWGKFSKWYDV